jgi:type II secretory pathway pseudopilin PulG
VIGEDLLLPVALAALAVVALLALAVALAVVRSARRDRARVEAALEDARREAEELRRRVDDLGRRPEPRATGEFVITDVGTPGARAGSPADDAAALPVDTRIDGRLFADIVLRETVVKAASLGYGVRRALAPETRNRIRFEMRREVKRSRRQRRAELKEFRRARNARDREQEVA